MAAFKVDVRRSPIATAVQAGIIYPGPSFCLGTDLGPGNAPVIIIHEPKSKHQRCSCTALGPHMQPCYKRSNEGA